MEFYGGAVRRWTKINEDEGSVTTAKGFIAGGIYAGLRAKENAYLALVTCDVGAILAGDGLPFRKPLGKWNVSRFYLANLSDFKALVLLGRFVDMGHWAVDQVPLCLLEFFLWSEVAANNGDGAAPNSCVHLDQNSFPRQDLLWWILLQNIFIWSWIDTKLLQYTPTSPSPHRTPRDDLPTTDPTEEDTYEVSSCKKTGSTIGGEFRVDPMQCSGYDDKPTAVGSGIS
ncbi:hypothetical protein KSP39_PZI022084 [Platanthera zijinensis]|uniref:Uncharacterized protein n=1 Tax=Platanthera zijinensis TaxID=2320716 RepID=A0AAP0AXF5_9ASPA